MKFAPAEFWIGCFQPWACLHLDLRGAPGGAIAGHHVNVVGGGVVTGSGCQDDTGIGYSNDDQTSHGHIAAGGLAIRAWQRCSVVDDTAAAGGSAGTCEWR
jgi:hypothetical protein